MPTSYLRGRMPDDLASALNVAGLVLGCRADACAARPRHLSALPQTLACGRVVGRLAFV
jgi:hypothetical protein